MSKAVAEICRHLIVLALLTRGQGSGAAVEHTPQECDDDEEQESHRNPNSNANPFCGIQA